MEKTLTERPSKLTRKPPMSKTFRDLDKSSNDAAVSGRSIADAIAAGVQFIFSRQQNERWSELVSDSGSPDQWVTAYILGRLGDLPADYFNPAQGRQIERALEWLLQARTKDDAWGCASGTAADADATAWAMIALRSHGKVVPASAQNWLQRCRRMDGGFAPHTEICQADCCKTGLSGITAVAAKALGELDSRAEGFLETELKLATSNDASALAKGFYVCSEVLDCEAALAPWSLLNSVCHLTALHTPEHAFELALLLRSLLRMRMRRARSIAEKLRALQKADGSWQGSPVWGPVLPGVCAAADQPMMDRSGLLATATAVSALWMAESRPRLSYGSDLPRPRRLPEV
jgi:hypothetical protein